MHILGGILLSVDCRIRSISFINGKQTNCQTIFSYLRGINYLLWSYLYHTCTIVVTSRDLAFTTSYLDDLFEYDPFLLGSAYSTASLEFYPLLYFIICPKTILSKHGKIGHDVWTKKQNKRNPLVSHDLASAHHDSTGSNHILAVCWNKIEDVMLQYGL